MFNGRESRGCVYCLIVMEQNLDLMEEKYGLMVKCPNLMNLSRGLNLPKNGFNKAPA